MTYVFVCICIKGGPITENRNVSERGCDAISLTLRVVLRTVLSVSSRVKYLHRDRWRRNEELLTSNSVLELMIVACAR